MLLNKNLFVRLLIFKDIFEGFFVPLLKGQLKDWIGNGGKRRNDTQ